MKYIEMNFEVQSGPVLIPQGAGYQPVTGELDLKRAQKLLFTFELNELHPLAPDPPDAISLTMSIWISSRLKCRYADAARAWYQGKIQPDFDNDLTILKITKNSTRIQYSGKTYQTVEWDGRDTFGMLLLPGIYSVHIKPKRTDITGALLKISIDLPTIYHIGGYEARFDDDGQIDIDDFSLRSDYGNNLQFVHSRSKSLIADKPQNYVVEIRNTIPERWFWRGIDSATRATLDIGAEMRQKITLCCHLGTAIQCTPQAVADAFNHGACTIVSGHGNPSAISYYTNSGSGRIEIETLTANTLDALSLNDNSLIIFAGCNTAAGSGSLTEYAIDRMPPPRAGVLAIGLCQKVNMILNKEIFKEVFNQFKNDTTAITDALTEAIKNSQRARQFPGDFCKLWYRSAGLSQLPFTPVRHFIYPSAPVVGAITYSIPPPSTLASALDSNQAQEGH